MSTYTNVHLYGKHAFEVRVGSLTDDEISLSVIQVARTEDGRCETESATLFFNDDVEARLTEVRDACNAALSWVRKTQAERDEINAESHNLPVFFSHRPGVVKATA